MAKPATAEFLTQSGTATSPSGGGDSLTSGLLLKLALAVAMVLIIVPTVAFAQTQSHPLSQVSPVDTDLNMNSRNITSLNYLLYTGGIFYSGSRGIPSADIATSAVTGAKIASGVITSSKLSNPLGGSVNASAYYDSDNSNYYLDPAGISTAFNSAGAIIINSGASSPTAGAGQTVISNLANSFYIGVPASTNLLRGFVDGLEVIRIDSLGRVGINNTNPQYALDVNGTAKIRGPRLDIGSGTEVAGQIGGINPWAGAGGLVFTTSGYWGGQYQFYSRPGGTETLAFTIDAADATGRILFGPDQDVNLYRSAGNVLKTDDNLHIGGDLDLLIGNNIKRVGNVTFGASEDAVLYRESANTLATDDSFHVVGDLNVTGTIYGSINTTGDVNCTQCVDTADIANSAVTSAKIANGAITSSDLSNPLGGSVNASAYYDSDNSNYYLDPGSSGTSLTTAGNVGIGTASPDGKVSISTTTSGANELLTLKNNQGWSGFLNQLQSIKWRDNSNVVGAIGARYDGTSVNLDIHSLYNSGYQGESSVAMTIKGNGNVGIGTTSPGTKLDVNGNVNATSINTTRFIYSTQPSSNLVLHPAPNSFTTVTTGTGATLVTMGAGEGSAVATYMPSGITYPFTIYSSTDTTSPIFRVLSNGRVGIGTTTPYDKLEVVSGGGDGIQIRSASRPTILFNVTGGAMTQGWVMEVTDEAGVGTAGDFAIREDAKNGAIRFVLQNNTGRVGIGVLNPSSMMHLQLGTADFSSLPITDPTLVPGLVIEGTTADDSSTPSIVLADEASGSTSNSEFIDFLAKDPSSSSYDRWVVGRRGYAASGGTNNRFIIGYTTSTNAHSAFNSPVITLLDSGKVGINNTSPSTALDVTGTITGTTKNFEIDHPTKEGYKLVHSSLEGPEVGVFYRGTDRLANGTAVVFLPEYFDALTLDNTSTVILTARGPVPFLLSYDNFDERSFVVYGGVSDGEFDWEVKAVRADVPQLVVEKPKEVAQ